MAKANRYFTKRGKKDVIINLDDEDIKIRIIIPTNRMHDEMMERYTVLTPEGLVDIHGTDLLEDRLTSYIVSLPFDVPYDEEMEIYGSWESATDSQKKIALSIMNSKLRDAINDAISGEDGLSSDELGE